ncbi:signal peptidase I [Massilimicrobiota timonensis]|uniref:signal peptidase I n=1 Tax=Massilimicrobiota timonensis TaxID=1776392 RepID=UPI0036F1A967
MLRKICNVLNSLIFIFLFVIAAALIVPNFIGYKSFAVISGSMEPNINVGSIVYVKEVDFNDLKVGDVVSYQLSGDTMVTHRIYSIDRDNQAVITKGDANDNVDSKEVTVNQIVGKVAFTIPLLGFITIYIKTPLAIVGVCGIIAILIILNFLPEIFEKKEDE